jgi:hypothetical protein
MQRNEKILVLAGLVIGGLSVAGCRRSPEPNPAADAAASAAASTADATPAPTGERADHGGGLAPGPAAGEAERRTVMRGDDDPVLRPYATRVQKHFKDPRTPLTVQRATLLGGGTAMLVRQEGEPVPLLLVEDRVRKLLWDRERPTIAMLPPVRDPVIVGRASGGVALFAYDVPAHVVAGRLLDADGTPFADLNVLRADDCQWLTAAQWPRRGLVVVCARPTENRLQIVRTDNTIGLALEGVVVGRGSRSPSPLSVAFDTADTMMLAQHVTQDGRDHLLVFRYDASGKAKWPAPLDVGEVRGLETAMERVAMSASSPPTGSVHIALPHGLAGKESVRSIDVDGNGAVH